MHKSKAVCCTDNGLWDRRLQDMYDSGKPNNPTDSLFENPT